MPALVVALVVVVLALLTLLGMAVRIVQQYQKGVLFRLGRVVGERKRAST
jgi:regulator of protease activity HflC (stomatin/prohibitin superfamily)